MFFLMPSYILIAAAVIPAIYLMRYVRSTDRMEPESPRILMRLVVGGIISTLIAGLAEGIGSAVLDIFFKYESVTYYAWVYYAVVGPAEECSKYYMLKKRSWRDPEFNCQYDGIVYAVFVSLGFALAENIKYVFMFGLRTAMIRAVTAIPGHACFGVFMGIWYGAAKRMENRQNYTAMKFGQAMAVLIPSLIHGTYDLIATVGRNWVFIIFIAVMFFAAFKTVHWMSASDRDITRG